MKRANVLTGLDLLAADSCDILRGLKVGLIANPASVDRNLRHVVDILFKEIGTGKDGGLVCLFGPEHGIRGALQDMEAEEDSIDQTTQLPVYSLYGNSAASLSPRKEQLEHLHAVVFDLQDVGSRYYTFVQTLAYTMKVAAQTGTKIIVLDRPNPIGGTTVEGTPLKPHCRSFCGLYNIANRHGLTVGEIATLMKRGFGEGEFALPAIDCDLEVITMKGWRRAMYYDETDLPWVLPSPNMPTLDTAIVYPGTCLLEATNMSEGRGTTRPFEIVGAPFIDGSKWLEAVTTHGAVLTGCALRPCYFVPKFQKWSNQLCGGVQVHITDRQTFQPYRLGLALIAAAYELYPDEFGWRQSSYEFVDQEPAIDLLVGSSEFRRAVESGKGLQQIFIAADTFEKEYHAVYREFFLYK